jgi:hypothetical protein
MNKIKALYLLLDIVLSSECFMTTFPIWLSQSYPKSDGSNGFTYYESINSFDMTYFGETLIGG